jgi:hypothetical protein
MTTAASIYYTIPFYSVISTATLCVIAIVGNSFSLCIFVQETFFKYSTNRYFAVLSFFHTCYVFLLWIFVIPSGMASSSFLCKFSCFLLYQVPEFNAWLLVVASVDRMLLTLYYERTKFLNRIQSQILIVSFIFFSLFMINITSLIVYDVITANNYTSCGKIDVNFARILDMVFVFLNTIIPFLFMSISSTILIFHVRKYGNISTNVAIKNLIKTLVGSNFSFLICNLPLSILRLFPINSIEIQFYFVLYQILTYVQIFYAVFAFFVYITFNVTFRRQFLMFFRRKRINPRF